MKQTQCLDLDLDMSLSVPDDDNLKNLRFGVDHFGCCCCCFLRDDLVVVVFFIMGTCKSVEIKSFELTPTDQSSGSLSSSHRTIPHARDVKSASPCDGGIL